jgi:hypothetical protein
MPALILAAFAALGCAVALLAMALVKWDLPPAFLFGGGWFLRLVGF